MINLVLQSFGKEIEYRRAVFTVMSFYAHISTSVAQTRVLLFTDKPEWFTGYFQELPVEYILLTPEKIKTMRGQIDFLHRMKISLIEEAFQRTDGNLLYIDSDTFFTADPCFLLDKLSPTNSFMHVQEYQFEFLRTLPLPAGKTFIDFLNLLESRTFKLTDNTEIAITAEHSSWNAGIMFLHRDHQKYIPDVYRLTEQFYPATLNHASEQYAFSILLQTRTSLQACDSIIYHYWYRVRKQIIDEELPGILSELINKPESRFRIIKKWTVKLPGYLDKHVLTLKDNAIQSFNENKFRTGYKWAMKALGKSPFSDMTFLKDILYHTKRRFQKS